MFGAQTFLNATDQQFSDELLHLWIHTEGQLVANTSNYPGYLITLPYQESFVMISGSKAIVYYPSATQAYIFAPLGCYYRIVSFKPQPERNIGVGMQLRNSSNQIIYDSAFAPVAIDYASILDYTVNDYPTPTFTVGGLTSPPNLRRRYLGVNFFEPFRYMRGCQPCLFSVGANSFTMDFGTQYQGPVGWVGENDWMGFVAKFYVVSGY